MAVTSSGLVALTAQITTAHCANNMVETDALPGLIRQIYQALASMDEQVVPAQKPMPAVSLRHSIFPDYIVCLEDGKKLTMLKRHLRSAYNMSPADYRARWDLPQDYPMVAPNYTERRSVLSRQIGLGRKSEKTAHNTAAADTDMPEVQHLPERKRRRTIA